MVVPRLGTDKNSGRVVSRLLSDPEEVLEIERKKRSGRGPGWESGHCIHQTQVASVVQASEFATFSFSHALLIETNEKNERVLSWSQIA